MSTIDPVAQATATAARRMHEDEYEAFLAGLGDRDRQNVERHVEFCATEPTDRHEKLWKRVACSMARLAPRAAQTTGQRAVRFFIADGKYRLQLFALEDLRDGNLMIYVGDALDAAIRADVLRGPVSEHGDAKVYAVCDDPGATLDVELLTGAKTTSAPDYYKHMLGWNRKALKVKLPLAAGAASVRAVEALCTLSARSTGK